MSKKSFVVYSDIKAILDKLTDKQVAKLFRTMVEYSIEACEPKFDDFVLDIAFTPIRQQMDRDAEKWEEIKEKRAVAGRVGGIKSGQVRAKQNEANEANASKTKQTKQKQANEAVTVTVNDNVTVTDTVNDTVTTTVTVAPPVVVVGDDGKSYTDIWHSITPADIDAIYDVYPDTGGDLIQEVADDVKQKRKIVEKPLAYILGYAKRIGWEESGL